jgi:hypothetical protein
VPEAEDDGNLGGRRMKKLIRSADRRLVGAAVVSGLLLAPLGIFGSSALAHTASGLGPSAAQYQYKVTICHRTHSQKHPWVQISISNRALPAHLRHGDKFPPPCPTTAQTTKKKHDNSSHSGPSTQTSSNVQNNGSSKSHGNSATAPGHDDSHGNNGHHGKS